MAIGKRAKNKKTEQTQEVAKVEVFTSPTCPHCPSALNFVKGVAKENEHINLVEVSVATREGRKKAEVLNVLGVPAIFVKGINNNVIGFRNIPSKKELLHSVNIALGKDSFPEKKGFLSKIFG